MFVPTHSTRSFVAGEVDMIGGIGYNPARWPDGKKPPGFEIRLIVTELAVLDFTGPNHRMSVRSLHPGVTFEEVQDNTGFPLFRPSRIAVTPAPSAHALQLIRERLDPHNLRAEVFKGNPSGERK
jgi:glutaconate CoA-transferase subunit B